MMFFNHFTSSCLQFLNLVAGDRIDLRVVEAMSYRIAHITLCISLLPAPYVGL